MFRFADHAGLQQDLHIVKNYMSEAVKCRNRDLQDCVDELLANPGKLLRPSLAVVSARALVSEGRDSFSQDRRLPESLYRTAAAIEILHMATLVHDDVIDEAATRRHKPSIYASRGPRLAILVGDLLFSGAFTLVSDLATKELTVRMAKSIHSITQSEILQMNRIDPERPNLRQYFHQIIGKTAVLFALSCRSGGEQVGASGGMLQSLQRAGYNLGMAFQIIDDILDFNPDDERTGKTPGRDIISGLLTLPALAALRDGGKNEAGKVLRKLLAQSNLKITDVFEIRRHIEELGGFSTSREWARKFSRRADRELARLPDNEAREMLLEFSHGLLLRTT